MTGTFCINDNIFGFLHQQVTGVLPAMAKGTPDPDYILRRDSCPIFSLCFMRDECWQYLLSGNQNGNRNLTFHPNLELTIRKHE